MGTLFGGVSSQGAESLVKTAKEEPVKTDTVQYVNPHVARLKMGRFQFENGRLELIPEEDEVFSKLLAGASARTRQQVQKVDREAGEAVAQRFLASRQGNMISGVSTTAQSVRAPSPSDPDNQPNKA